MLINVSSTRCDESSKLQSGQYVGVFLFFLFARPRHCTTPDAVFLGLWELNGQALCPQTVIERLPNTFTNLSDSRGSD